MKFDIIGSGAIGLLFATKLTQAKFDVTIWCKTRQIAEKMNNRGFSFIAKEGRLEHKQVINSYSFDQLNLLAPSEQDDIVYGLVTVKQVHFDQEFLNHLRLLVIKREYTALVLLQNGIGHVEQLAQIIDIPIITAVTSEASKRHTRYKVEHTGVGHTFFGDELGRDMGNKHQENIEKALQIAGFNISVSKNIKEYVYRKLIINCVINPLTAIFNCTNGELPLHNQRLVLMKALYSETIAIVKLDRNINIAMPFEDIISVCQATANNTSSMRADILSGMKTEISSINGAIVKMAKKYNVHAPLNESMVHLIEALHPNG